MMYQMLYPDTRLVTEQEIRMMLADLVANEGLTDVNMDCDVYEAIAILMVDGDYTFGDLGYELEVEVQW